jgi:hypothetical protein
MLDTLKEKVGIWGRRTAFALLAVAVPATITGCYTQFSTYERPRVVHVLDEESISDSSDDAFLADTAYSGGNLKETTVHLSLGMRSGLSSIWDSDGDGIPDAYDPWPFTYGPYVNHGTGYIWTPSGWFDPDPGYFGFGFYGGWHRFGSGYYGFSDYNMPPPVFFGYPHKPIGLHDHLFDGKRDHFRTFGFTRTPGGPGRTRIQNPGIIPGLPPHNPPRGPGVHDQGKPKPGTIDDRARTPGGNDGRKEGRERERTGTPKSTEPPPRGYDPGKRGEERTTPVNPRPGNKRGEVRHLQPDNMPAVEPRSLDRKPIYTPPRDQTRDRGVVRTPSYNTSRESSRSWNRDTERGHQQSSWGRNQEHVTPAPQQQHNPPPPAQHSSPQPQSRGEERRGEKR